MTRRTFLAVLVAIAVSGCSHLETPTSASEPEPPVVSNFWGHGMTVSDPNGDILWVCETQPRMYGDGKWVVDKYVSDVPCPTQKIE